MGGEQQGQQFSSLDHNNTAYQLDTTPVDDLTDAQIAELLDLDFLNNRYLEEEQQQQVLVGVGNTGCSEQS